LLNEGYFAPPKIFISVSNEDLYKYQVANKEHDLLLKSVLRLYGGEVFSNFVSVSEVKIAKHSNMTPQHLQKALRLLHQKGIIVYEPQHEVPQLVFTTARYDASQLPLDYKKLGALRKTALGKVNAVEEYISCTDRCRTQLILAYFGELSTASCRVCDYCLAQKKQKRKGELLVEQEKKILNILLTEARHPKSVVEVFSPSAAEQVTGLLREMVDRGLIRYDSQGYLHLVPD
jgi:ATP-dependent DNA helicase RecQ